MCAYKRSESQFGYQRTGLWWHLVAVCVCACVCDKSVDIILLGKHYNMYESGATSTDRKSPPPWAPNVELATALGLSAAVDAP